VLSVRDLWTGFDSAQPGGVATLPKENMLTLTLANGGTATVRASGTEPKIKCVITTLAVGLIV
jgi:phosphomannomutase